MQIETKLFKTLPLAPLTTPAPREILTVVGLPLLRRLPAGARNFSGIPFVFQGRSEPGRWIWVGPGAKARVTIPIDRLAPWLVVAHFCGVSRDSGSDRKSPEGAVLHPGEHLADYTLRLVDGSEHRQPIRRRFEINDLIIGTGQTAFAARSHRETRLLSWRGPHEAGRWGRDQTGAELPFDEDIWASAPFPEPVGNYWIYAVPNPFPDCEVAALDVSAEGGELIAIGAITIYSGDAHPLRHEPSQTLRFTSPDSPQLQQLNIGIDLGIASDRRAPRPLSMGDRMFAGLGDSPKTAPLPKCILLDVAASPAASLTVGNSSVGLARIRTEGSVTVGHTRVEFLQSVKRPITVSVRESGEGTLLPCRVHFETGDGDYLPPDGHRRDVNTNWFEDYGGDLVLGAIQYAYVDAPFRIDLPVGEPLAVEVTHGFEHRPVREEISLDPSVDHLDFGLQRVAEWQSAGWMSADTHVHFLSPQTAWLEARAEGVNLVNLLAAQWGDLFTNAADFTGAASGVSTHDTTVWVGTENRQHLLGHLSLLGLSGSLVGPISAGGPSESYVGDSVRTNMAGWADDGHRRRALVVAPHFPVPYCELPADLLTGRIDAVEVRDFWWGSDSYGVRQWYRYLNMGLRVPVVGGTDKMSAGMPIGGVRTYAWIGEAEMSFASFAAAVRNGRTFTTSGPMIELFVEGRRPGDTVALSRNGTVNVSVAASCVYPLRWLEVVLNGRVISRIEARSGERVLSINEQIGVGDGGWLAARCDSHGIAWHNWPVSIAAHTSPVYLDAGVRMRPAVEDIRFISALLDGGQVWLDTLATSSEQQRRDAKAVFSEALKVLREIESHS